jgi:iron complex outermembrane receptor protein
MARMIVWMVSMALFATGSMSLLAAEAEDETAPEIEEIVVTGSHIPQAELQGPVAILDRDILSMSGAATLGDALRRFPMVDTGVFTGRSSDSFALGGTGLSVHGLGVNTTLVLVNGRRMPYYGFASMPWYRSRQIEQFADINSIPLAAVERVEVLKDGASAIYGSDAIGGVINIVLRSRFDGFEVTGFAGAPNRGGAEESGVNGVWGKDFGSSSVTVMANYSNRESLFWRDRQVTRTANHRDSFGGDDLRSYPTSFYVERWGGLNGAECEERSVPGEHEFELKGSCRYDENLQVSDMSDERLGATVVYSKALEHERNFQVEASFSNSNGVGQLAPDYYFLRPGGVKTSPDRPDIFFPEENPWNPFGADTYFWYQFAEAGPTENQIDTDSQRMLATMTGAVNAWDWEIGLLISRANSKLSARNFLDIDHLKEALHGIDLNGDATLQDEEYLNLYTSGSNPNSIEILDYITETRSLSATTMMHTVDAQLSGKIVEMPGGPLMFAAGIEHRYESQFNRGDDRWVYGHISWSMNTDSDRHVSSVFAEFRIPLFWNIEIQPAGRYDYYSDFGDIFSPRVSVVWNPMSWLQIRGSWGESYTAPTLYDLNLDNSGSHIWPFATDPIRCPVTGDDYDCAEGIPRASSLVGNPDAPPGEAETISLGLSIQPLEGLRISADYWKINQFAKTAYDIFYPDDYRGLGLAEQGVVREDPTPEDILLGIPGRIIEVNQVALDVSGRRAEGYDFELNYAFRTDNAGAFNVRGYWSHVSSFDMKEWSDFGEYSWTEFAGEYGTPKDRGQLTFFWQGNRLGLMIGGQYIGDHYDVYYCDCEDPVIIPSHFELDTQVSFEVTPNIRLIAGVENLLDESPPFAIAAGAQGYSSALYNSRGRFSYVRATLSY